jgi:succinyl-CoA synthetase beta subunit
VRLLEYQGKRLLGEFDLQFNEWQVAEDPDSIIGAAEPLGYPVVLKAQVPTGGRGKAGAIKFAKDPDDCATQAQVLFNMMVGPYSVASVSVEKALAFESEYYLGATWDTVAKLPMALIGSEGGVDVEAERRGIVRRTFDPRSGLPSFAGREMAYEAGVRGRPLIELGEVLAKLCRAFLACDLVIAEINPLVPDGKGGFIGLDAHIELEDDALYRQKGRLTHFGHLESSAFGREATAMELEAQRIDSMDHRGVAGRVVEFDGDLALLIGGGGASLTVFDAIRRHGGRPANYCEIGGNPTEQKVAALTTLLMSNPNVRRLAIIMNVVNNTRADVIARGVLAGLTEAGRNPSETISVFRIPGSWENEAAAIMLEAGIRVLGREHSLDGAAKIAVKAGAVHAG